MIRFVSKRKNYILMALSFVAGIVASVLVA